MIHKLYDDKVTVEFMEASHRYKIDGTFAPGVSTVLNMLHKDLMGWAVYMAIGAYTEAITPYATTEAKITKIALKELAEQAGKAHTRKSDRGKDVGTLVHAVIANATQQYIDKGDWPDDAAMLKNIADVVQEDISPDDFLAVNNCVQNWRQWVKDYDVEPVESERIVASFGQKYCGTFDILFRSNRTGKLYMGDYKTSEPMKIRNSKYIVTGHKAYPEHFVQCAAYDLAFNEETGTEPDGYAVIYLPKEEKYQMFTREDVTADRLGWLHLFHAYQWFDKVKKGK